MAMDIAQGMNYLHSLIPVVIHRLFSYSAQFIIKRSKEFKYSSR